MNQTQKLRFRTYAAAQLNMLRNTLRTGANRGASAKEDNYREVVDLLQYHGFNTQAGDIIEAVAILKDVLQRELEVQAPLRDNGAARMLNDVNRDSSTARAVINGIDVRLDIDQLKHQHPTVPIGTRQKGGGNRFVKSCDENWHQANTMAHMAQWAQGIGAMSEGQRVFHGQATPVGDVHYEGFCLMSGGRKYVLFHCYPSNTSRLKL